MCIDNIKEKERVNSKFRYKPNISSIITKVRGRDIYYFYL